MKFNWTLAGALIVTASVSLDGVSRTMDRFRSESAPVARGQAHVGGKGCVTCHGVPNFPGPDANYKECSDTNSRAWHPAYDGSCTDAMAYFASIRLRRNFSERVQLAGDNLLIEGERLARTYHCFQCHGQLGQGGLRNAQSLKGYIPGYFGDDFRYLTDQADPESIRNWIANGTNPTLVEQPLTGWIAKFFLSRQEIGMPKFESLQPGEIDLLVRYVAALNAFGPMTADTIHHYEQLSRRNNGGRK